jgi:asparagine synthase (glutamine-hydrolysing)
MCGIAGYIGRGFIDKDRIVNTLDLMKNRGPNYRGSISFCDGDVSIVLLHSRLSIIDLDKRSNQPFTIGDYTLIFNGEIYNYLELREELKKKGVSFKTASDTEVLLQSYILYGEECVNRFEGMWSFAIYDRNKRRLFLSRDRFSEKPLCYLETSDGIYFGSEIKHIRSLSGKSLTINMQHLFRYMVNGYKSLYKTKETFFKEIREVPYATNLMIGHDLVIVSKRYWTPVFNLKDMTLDEAIEGLRHHLLESMKIRLRADVPIAFCLSGGVDSSALASIAAKYFKYDAATFSIIDSDERYNEYDNMRATIDDIGCKHTIINISQDNTFKRLKDLVTYHDAPIYTISYYIHSFLSEAISKSGYKVVVSGTGADELVTGYYDHFNLHLYEMRNHKQYRRYSQDWKEKVEHYVRNPFLKDPEMYFDQPDFRGHIYLNNDIFSGFLKHEFKEVFFENKYCDSLLRNRMLNELFHEAIPVILNQDDLNSMFYSIENRSPYLDSRLFNFAYSIPNEHLIQDGYAKYILRQAVRGILNEKVRTDRRKKGFNASINSLFDFNKKSDRDYFLDDSKIFDFIKKDKIEQLLQDHPLPNSFSKFLFCFLNAKIFLELNK